MLLLRLTAATGTDAFSRKAQPALHEAWAAPWLHCHIASLPQRGGDKEERKPTNQKLIERYGKSVARLGGMSFVYFLSFWKSRVPTSCFKAQPAQAKHKRVTGPSSLIESCHH